MKVGSSVDMVSPLALVLTPLLDFFGYPDGAATELKSGTVKLRYSSAPLF